MTKIDQTLQIAINPLYAPHSPSHPSIEGKVVRSFPSVASEIKLSSYPSSESLQGRVSST